jgi:hypothetical protein
MMKGCATTHPFGPDSVRKQWLLTKLVSVFPIFNFVTRDKPRTTQTSSYRLHEGGDNTSNPLRAIGDGIDAGIQLVVGAIILVLCIFILGAILSIPH